MAADANYGVPIAQFVTTAKRNDSPELPAVIDRAEALYSWFRPAAVIADRGYDGRPNHTFLNDKGIIPIIHIKRPAKAKLYEGIYTEQGVPTCVGQVPMEYVRIDPALGRLYRCWGEGCHLAGSLRGGSHHCADEVWEDPTKDIRLSGSFAGTGPSGRPCTRSGRPSRGCSNR